MENNVEELAVNIAYCPYCGSNGISHSDDVNCYCDECGRGFAVITHE